MSSTESGIFGWHLAGSRPDDYEHAIAPDEDADGMPVAYLRSRTGEASGFGTLMQEIAADAHHGARLRFSGRMRTRDVRGWTGFWMRVDGPERGKPLAFDNMQGRSVHGTTDWTGYSVVLGVPDEAWRIAFGVLLSGPGEVRVARFQLERVTEDVPTTDRVLPEQPRNLDLSESFGQATAD